MLATACGSTVSRRDILSMRRGGGEGAAQTPGANGGADSATGAVGAASGNGGSGVSAGDTGAAVVGGRQGGTPGPARGSNGPSSGGASSGRAGVAAGSGGAALSGCRGGSSDVGVTSDTLTIGNVSANTGVIAYPEATEAVASLINEVNDAGGICGRRIILKAIDDGGDSGRNAAAVRDLATQVFAFVGNTSVADAGGVPALAEHKVPILGYALSNPVFSLPTFAHVGANLAVKGETTGHESFAVRTGRVHKMGFIYLDAAVAQQEADKARQVYASKGIPSCADEKVELTEPDLTAHVVRMRQAGCDGFWSVLDPYTGVKLQRAMARQGWKPYYPLYPFTAYDPTFTDQLTPQEIDGIWIFLQVEPFDSGGEMQHYTSLLHRYYPADKPKTLGVYAWADTMAFLEALRNSGPNPTRTRLYEELGKLKDYTANGLVAPHTPTERSLEPCFVMLHREGGRFVRKFPPDQGFDCSSPVNSNIS
ncbi:MAG: ABC transporter substrate-binding protein [Acidimicrobiales bacterium]